jgi:translation initiation factor IF-2
MGHVDHGKTSILDFIRKTSVTKGEAGGITQHIGAYSIKFNNQKITFVDTPGHAAFTDMRARGANLTDIVIIVVAADDGVMPQTIEAINHSKAANASIIVAINKIDKGLGNIDRIYTQLSELSLLPEDWGGDTPIVKVSARTGEGINDLLETILVLAEIKELRANPKRKAQGIVVEARLDKGMGPVATVIIQNGTLSVGSYVVAGVTSGRIRGMYNDLGERIRVAGPSTAVSIQGLQDVPLAGDILLSTEDEKTMRQVVQERLNKEKTQKITSRKISLEDLYKEIEEGKLKNLNLIIKTDVQGSAEALKESLIDLSDSEVKVNSIHAMAGAINESDVMLAETTNSIIIGFNVRPDAKAKALAEQKNIEIKIYRVIYDAIDDISKAIKGLSAPKFREEYLGSAEVRVVYTITGVGLIAGCIVKDGKIVRNARVRLIRDNIVVAETSITSLKRVKDDVKEVAAGIECGIGLDKIESLEKGDIIESFLVKSNK